MSIAPTQPSDRAPHGPSGYSLALLTGLANRPRHVYAGTVPDHVTARRRAVVRTVETYEVEPFLPAVTA